MKVLNSALETFNLNHILQTKPLNDFLGSFIGLRIDEKGLFSLEKLFVFNAWFSAV